MLDDILGKHSSLMLASDLVSSEAWSELLSRHSKPLIMCLFLLENAVHQGTMTKSSQNQEFPNDCNCESIKTSPVIESSFDDNNSVCMWKAPSSSFQGSAQTPNVADFQPEPSLLSVQLHQCWEIYFETLSC